MVTGPACSDGQTDEATRCTRGRCRGLITCTASQVRALAALGLAARGEMVQRTVRGLGWHTRSQALSAMVEASSSEHVWPTSRSVSEVIQTVDRRRGRSFGNRRGLPAQRSDEPLRRGVHSGRRVQVDFAARPSG